MTTTERPKGQVIRLSHKDGGQVCVEPADEDRFVMAAQNAVEACKDHAGRAKAIQIFKQEFVQPLIEWTLEHRAQIKACYIPMPMGSIQVFVVGTSPKYDFSFGDELAKLELQFADAGWHLSILQLPAAAEEDLQTFFDTEGALEIYAELEAAPRKSGA
jgi:hypothetical protein